jgi:TonB-dependent starch-binding outer membrane protein SusC
MRKLLLFFAGCCCALISSAQTKQISGKITDEAGKPLSGVSVMVKGTSNGTTTNAAGAFTLDAPDNATLTVSGIGYETREMSVTGRTEINVQLPVDSKLMAEVVVTGTGVATTKKKLSIDVASVGNKDFAKSAILSVDQALIGKIAGAKIQSTSGEPGSKANIVLRGINSLGSSTPIILVDGVQVSDINGLDVSAVEKVEVAKGPAAAMLYGAQGANGVIQIFTKKGSRNKKVNITLSSKVSIDKALIDKNLTAKLHHFKTDAQGNILDQNGQVLKPGANGQWPDPQEEDFNTNFGLKNDKAYNGSLPLYDHLKQAYNTAASFTNSLNLSGGGEKSDYSFTFSRLDQENVLNNKFSRMNLTSNLGFELYKGLTFRNTTQTILEKENLLSGNYSNVTSRILYNVDVLFQGTNNNRFELVNSFPWMDFKAKYPGTDLTIVRPRDENQLNALSEPNWHERSSKTTRILNNANLNYKFPRFVELDYKYGVELWNSDYTDFYKNQLSAPQSDKLFWGSTVNGSLRLDFNKSTYQNSLATLYLRTDFEKDFKINIPIQTSTQVSYDWRKLNYNSFFSQGINLPQYPPFVISSASQKVSGDGSFDYVTYGYLVNQVIDYGNLFGVTGGFRSDYNSDFGDQSKPFTFGRATAYFRPSELLKSKNITDWKIRGAYGAAGVPPNEFDGTYYTRQTTLGALPLGTNTALFLQTTAGNEKLKVQTVKELEAGTDLTFKANMANWFHRVNLSFTYWKKKNDNIIQYVALPPSAGVQQIRDNLINLEVKGADISLDADMYNSNNIDWKFGVRFGTFKTLVTKVANGRDFVNGLFVIRQGEALGNFYTVTPLKSLTQTRPDKTRYIDAAQEGDFEVVNGIVVNKTTKRAVLTDPNDQSIVGNAYPKFNMSFINTITLFKNLGVTFQWDWYHGNSVYNLTRQWMYRDRIHKDFDKPVTINGETGNFVNYYNSLYNSVQRTGWFVEDGSFLRLRDLTLTYQLGSLINAKWVKNITFNASARNLVTFSKYSGLDPEATTAGDSQGNRTVGAGVGVGADYFGVPNLRSYQAGVVIEF